MKNLSNACPLAFQSIKSNLFSVKNYVFSSQKLLIENQEVCR